MRIEIPETRLTDVPMSPVEERARGHASPGASLLDGWLQIGEPLVRELTASALTDSPLAGFLEQSTNYRFILMYFACSFRPASGESFEKAWFKVKLTSTAGISTAWSMTPSKLADDCKLTSGLTLGAELKLEPVTVKAERSKEFEMTVGEVYIEALNLLSSDPIWELRRTKVRELRGLHQLQLVAKVPRNGAASAEFSLEASVKRKALGVIPYSALLEGRAGSVVKLT